MDPNPFAVLSDSSPPMSRKNPPKKKVARKVNPLSECITCNLEVGIAEFYYCRSCEKSFCSKCAKREYNNRYQPKRLIFFCKECYDSGKTLCTECKRPFETRPTRCGVCLELVHIKCEHECKRMHDI